MDLHLNGMRLLAEPLHRNSKARHGSIVREIARVQQYISRWNDECVLMIVTDTYEPSPVLRLVRRGGLRRRIENVVLKMDDGSGRRQSSRFGVRSNRT